MPDPQAQTPTVAPPPPVYLDENGNPKGSTPATAAPPPQSAPQSGGVYLDEQGNPKGAATGTSQGATIGPKPKASDADLGTTGEVLSAVSPIGQLTMPLVKGLLAAHDKLKEVENMTQEGQAAHPIQAHIGALANRIEGLLTGTTSGQGIGTGEEGLLTNPVTGSLLPTGEGVPALAEGLEGVGNLAKKGYQAAKELVTGGASKVADVGEQIIKGKSLAQEPAKEAIRTAVGAQEDAALLEGNKTVVDKYLDTLAKKEKAAYKIVDDEAGFDVKEAKIRLKNDQYKLKQLGNTEADQNAREKLTTVIEDTSKRLTEAGVDTSEADNLHKSRMAGQEFKKALVRNLSSDGETVDVPGLLKAAKNLRALSKYGDRLEQFLGSKEKADQFMESLEAAQKAGQKAISSQQLAIKLAKYGIPAITSAGGAAVGAYELLK